MIGLQAEKHELVDEGDLQTAEQYVLHLMHSAAYLHAARVVEGKSVLDVGCNTGYGSNILSTRAERVVGVDVSERAIMLAKKKYMNTGIEFQVINGIRIPFEDNSFDIVTCFQLIEHLVEYGSFLNEVKRVLTPNGIVVFTTPNALLRLDPGMKPWNQFHVREFSSDELGDTLKNYFKHVCILALYAREPIHTIVVNRADRIRRSARARTTGGPAKARRKTLRTRAKAFLPTWVATRLAALRGLKDSTPSLRFIKDNHCPEDFHYQKGGLSDSLEFMAICSEGDIVPYIESLADRHT